MSEAILREDLRRHDPDRYLVSLFAPADRQAALWALFCFNHEITKTRFVVTETQLGLIRLQWWREEIGKLYEGGEAPANPVLQGLEAAIRNYGLPKALFENMIYAREFDLEGAQPQGLEGLESYAELTTTPLNKLALQIAGEQEEEGKVQTVSIRYCLAKLYLAIPFHKAHNHVLIDEGEQAAVVNLLQMKPSPVAAKLLRAQAALCDIYLKKLKSCNFDPAHKRMAKPPIFKELRVWLQTLGR